MQRVPQPRRAAYQEAFRLGRKMAGAFPRLRPQLKAAGQYREYEDFCLAHRLHLENTRVFAIWERKILAIAEVEGRHYGINLDRGSRTWDAFYGVLFTPVKNAFWAGWEDAWKLGDRFVRERDLQNAKPMEGEVSVFPASLLLIKQQVKQEVESAEPQWDGVATKLFDEMNADGDERMWEMPVDGLAQRSADPEATPKIQEPEGDYSLSMGAVDIDDGEDADVAAIVPTSPLDPVTPKSPDLLALDPVAPRIWQYDDDAVDDVTGIDGEASSESAKEPSSAEMEDDLDDVIDPIDEIPEDFDASADPPDRRMVA